MSPSPWFELAHPWGTGLYDFQFHVLLVTVAVGTADQITDFKVCGFEVAERDMLIAIGKDAVEMFLDHTRKAVIGFKAAPFELCHPAIEKLTSPCLGSV